MDKKSQTAGDGEAPKDDEARPGRRAARRSPRKPTRRSLENAALAYLGRFAATARGLEQVLMRRVHRAARAGVADDGEGAALVSAIVARYREAGLIDDAAFAEARARSLFAHGVALRAIRLRLAQKGVGPAEIERALAALAEQEGAGNARALEVEAARRLARRRRLGPWRDPARRGDMRERDLAALARAGFSYAIARAVVDGEDE
ncbi:MAG: hypothetical protein RL477_2217 [Pseudomonadota bacterium]|jgi:regulatory protein